MTKRLGQFQRPKTLKKEESSATPTYAKYFAEPFETGFGHTVGNSLRRILLSSIEGAAISAVTIEGVQHEFQPIEGVVEDVTEIVLNLKKVRIRTEANNHGIEIFAAPELARALYFTTDLEQSIPDALYFAVAQVIAYVFGLGQVQPGIAPMARPVPKIPASMLFDSDGHHLSTQEPSK